jgi:hypothetical protein
MSCYLVETADSYRVATLDRRLACISYHHKQARHLLPTKNPKVERTMRGVRPAKGMAPNGKAPLLPAQQRQAIDALPDTGVQAFCAALSSGVTTSAPMRQRAMAVSGV